MLETEFRTKFLDRVREEFPGILIVKPDPTFMQGFPDRILLYGKHWGVLEFKRATRSPKRPNQPHYVALANRMSFGAFVTPENAEEVLRALQQSFKA